MYSINYSIFYFSSKCLSHGIIFIFSLPFITNFKKVIIIYCIILELLLLTVIIQANYFIIKNSSVLIIFLIIVHNKSILQSLKEYLLRNHFSYENKYISFFKGIKKEKFFFLAYSIISIYLGFFSKNIILSYAIKLK